MCVRKGGGGGGQDYLVLTNLYFERKRPALGAMC